MKNLFVLSVLVLATTVCSVYGKDPQKNYYQIKVYHLKNKAQEAQLENYLKNAYVPALHRAGIKQVGVFKLADIDTVDLRVYVFIPFSKFELVETVTKTVQSDKQYLEAGKEYIQAPFNNPAYVRIESILLRAFPGMPAPAVPKLSSPENERIYELRSYESASEKYGTTKIKQFNYGDGTEKGYELSIFNHLNFNPVFYAETLFGSKTPNLMYMTSFSNKADREEHWKSFNTNAEWQKLRAMDEYKNTVSKNTIVFLYPADYSDF